jgi:hypothetical protein
LTKVGTITYQKYDYNGGLSGMTKGVGVWPFIEVVYITIPIGIE